MGPFGLQSPQKTIAHFPGRDLSCLRELTVALARYVVFGDDVLAKSSKSGRNNTYQLDSDKLQYIRRTIRERVGTQKNEEEFELIWEKCMESLGKFCQKLCAKKQEMAFTLPWLLMCCFRLCSFAAFVIGSIWSTIEYNMVFWFYSGINLIPRPLPSPVIMVY